MVRLCFWLLDLPVFLENLGPMLLIPSSGSWLFNTEVSLNMNLLPCCLVVIWRTNLNIESFPSSNQTVWSTPRRNRRSSFATRFCLPLNAPTALISPELPSQFMAHWKYSCPTLSDARQLFPNRSTTNSLSVLVQRNSISLRLSCFPS